MRETYSGLRLAQFGVIVVLIALYASVPLTVSAASLHPTIATGTVTDATTGSPVAEATVSLQRYYTEGDDGGGEWGWWEWASDTYANTLGAYVLLDVDGYGPGQYRLSVNAPGYSSGFRTIEWDGATPIDADFALDALPVIATGTITDARSGQPLAGASVYTEFQVYDEEWDEWWWGDAWATTDETGTFALYGPAGVGAGEYTFSVHGPWSGLVTYVSQTFTETWDGTAPLELAIALEPVVPDAFEPDDTPAQAKAVPTDGSPQQRALYPAGDEDWAIKVATVDQYRANSATQGWREVVWESGALSPGTHTIKIVPTGTKNPSSTKENIVIDAIDVRQ